MGCDYYIYVYLEIEHTNGISYYELPIIRGYYCNLNCGVCDSDDDENDYYYNSIDYKTLYENMKKLSLTPRKPIIIYNNNAFTRPIFEKKYLQIIQQKLHKKYVEKYPRHEDTGTFTNTSQIIKITKKEERYDPWIRTNESDDDNDTSDEN